MYLTDVNARLKQTLLVKYPYPLAFIHTTKAAYRFCPNTSSWSWRHIQPPFRENQKFWRVNGLPESTIDGKLVIRHWLSCPSLSPTALSGTEFDCSSNYFDNGSFIDFLPFWVSLPYYFISVSQVYCLNIHDSGSASWDTQNGIPGVIALGYKVLMR